MSNYTKATNFASKDSLSTGNPSKIVKGTEIDTEFNSISSAIASKADLASPTFTGSPAAPTATTGSNTTQLANTAYVKQELASLGKTIIQVVSARSTNSTQTTGSSYIDTFNTLTITPTSTSSKIILFAESMVAFWNYGGAAKVRMIRDTSSNIVLGDQWLWASNGFTGAPYQTYTSMTLHGVDEPATTSAVTYKVQLAAYSSGPTGTAMYGAYDTNGTIFTAIEVL